MVIRAVTVAVLGALGAVACGGQSMVHGDPPGASGSPAAGGRAGTTSFGQTAQGGTPAAGGVGGGSDGARGGAPANASGSPSGAGTGGTTNTSGGAGDTALAEGGHDVGAAGTGGGITDGGSPAGGALGGAESGGAPGEGGVGAAVGEFPPRGQCGTPYRPNLYQCEGLEQVAISAGPMLDADGNDGISPGEDATVVITLHNAYDQLFNGPCVGLIADDPRITDIYGDVRGWNPWTRYYAIIADQSQDYKAHFHLSADIEPGTVIHFLVWVTIQTAECTNGNELELTLEVAP